MVRVFAYLRLTPAEGTPVTLAHPVWTVQRPVYSTTQREHRVATNKGFSVRPLETDPGQVVVQAQYEPQRGLAGGARRTSPWYEDLGIYPGPQSVAALKGQIVTVEWAGLSAPMHFREMRFTGDRYIDSDNLEPAGAPIRTDFVLTFAETDPTNLWL